MLQKSGRLVLWEAMFILELHSAETQVKILKTKIYNRIMSGLHNILPLIQTADTNHIIGTTI